jgi:hypothetical protein
MCSFLGPLTLLACALPAVSLFMSSYANNNNPDYFPSSPAAPVSLTIGSPVSISSQSAAQYSTSRSYYVSLVPPDGYSVVVTFSSLSTESCCDLVTLRDGSFQGATLAGPYSGSPLPLQPTTGSNSTPLLVFFYSETSVVSTGLNLFASLVCSDPSCGASPSPSATPSSSPRLLCDAGFYPSGSNCSSCPSNTYSLAGATACTPCGAASVSTGGASACSAVCPAGQFASAAAGSSLSTCQRCPANTISTAAGSTSCTPCSPYASVNSGSTACTVPTGSLAMAPFLATTAASRPAAAGTPAPLSASNPPLRIFSQVAAQYATSTGYSITLTPPRGYAVRLTFTAFSTEPSYDQVLVFSNASLNGAVLGGPYSGSTLPPPIQAPPNWSPSVLLFSDSSNTAAGIAFVASLVCMEPSCAGAPVQPSASPLPTSGLGGVSPGYLGGGGGASASASAELDAGAATGIAVGVLLVVALGAAAAVLVCRAKGRLGSRLAAAEQPVMMVSPFVAAGVQGGMGGGGGGGFQYAHPAYGPQSVVQGGYAPNFNNGGCAPSGGYGGAGGYAGYPPSFPQPGGYPTSYPPPGGYPQPASYPPSGYGGNAGVVPMAEGQYPPPAPRPPPRITPLQVAVLASAV